jgi:hypothetical protein
MTDPHDELREELRTIAHESRERGRAYKPRGAKARIIDLLWRLFVRR